MNMNYLLCFLMGAVVAFGFCQTMYRYEGRPLFYAMDLIPLVISVLAMSLMP